jgi:hypothetical protein
VKEILSRTERIAAETQRMAGNGGDDVLPEAGPDQPDPTDTQAYVKEIQVTPDHSVLESLSKKSKHAPTASRKAECDEDEEDSRQADLEMFAEPEDEPISEMEDDEDDFVDEDEFEDEDLDDEIVDEGIDFSLDEEDQDLEAMLEYASDDGDADDFEDEGEFDTFDEDETAEDVEEPDIVDEEDLEGDEDVVDDYLEEDEMDVETEPLATASRKRASRHLSLEDALELEGKIASATTSMEGDDMDALMGAKVVRTASQNRGAKGSIPKITPSDRLEGLVWDTENDPELARSSKVRRARPQKSRRASRRQEETEVPQIRKPKRSRSASKQSFAPDRRRIASQRMASGSDEFDSVFGVPDVSSYFQD